MGSGQSLLCQASLDTVSQEQMLIGTHSISHSPKGWTDQELGLIWLKWDFHPTTAKRNISKGYRLLILDGHNSHTTYELCAFAEKHRIIIICLPPHTTHHLQPCDVGVFGPLAGTWKTEVNLASAQYIEIRKQNLLKYYSHARVKALSPEMIRSSFRTTGIWPFNPDAIEKKEKYICPSIEHDHKVSAACLHICASSR